MGGIALARDKKKGHTSWEVIFDWRVILKNNITITMISVLASQLA